MISIWCEVEDKTCKVLIQPNRSIGWNETVVILTLSFSLAIVIALSFLFMGAWVVVPFTGLEMLALFAALYYVGRQQQGYELLSIGKERVSLQYWLGHRYRHGSDFQRYWLRLEVEKDKKNWYADRVKLCSHGRCEEIATRLAEEEKYELILALKQLL